ncbi:MAG TPA: hypothetical protein VGM53_09095 [Streptosporangiaceae bacterium]
MDTWSHPSPQAGGEPSWPRVLATTVQLWLRRRRLHRVYVALVAVVAALAAGIGVALAQGGTTHRVRQSAAQAAHAGRTATPASQAAGWVAAQVSHTATVACDPAMCASLQRDGFPPGNLVPVRPGAADPAEASLALATPALRGTLGGALATRYAPVALASFGTGSGAVVIRAAAPDGAAAYLARLRADLAARRSVGAELLHNPAVGVTSLARQQLSDGRADPRLIATIGVMAALHPVHLVSFGDPSPGAGPDVPLRSVLLYGVTHGVTAGNALLSSLRGLLLAQQPSYRPATVATVRLSTGQSALRVVFSAPAPLGLLDTSQPVVKLSAP